MKSKKYDQDLINELAVRDNKNGYASEELWNLVKNIAGKKLRNAYIPSEDHHSIGFIALDSCLKYVNPERGHFSYLYGFHIGSYIREYYDTRDTIHLPKTTEKFKAKTDLTYDRPVMKRPDGVFTDKGLAVWETLDDFATEPDVDTKLEEADILRIADTFVDREKTIILLRLEGKTYERIADELGITAQWVHRIKERMMDRLEKRFHDYI